MAVSTTNLFRGGSTFTPRPHRSGAGSGIRQRLFSAELLHRSAAAANRPETLQDAALAVLDALCQSVPCRAAEVLLRSRGRGWIVHRRRGSSSHEPDPGHESWLRSQPRVQVAVTRGIGGWIDGQGDRATTPRAPTVGAVVPVIADGAPDGAILIHFPEVPPDYPFLETLEEIGRMLGEVVVRTRARPGRQRAEEQPAIVLAAAPDALVAVDNHGKTVLSNEAVEDLLGYSPDDVVGRPIRTLLPGLQTGPHSQDHGPESAPRALARHRYVGALSRDGSDFPPGLTRSDSAPGEKAMVMTIRHLTDQLRTERSLSEAAVAQSLLAEAGRLLVSSLEYATTLESVAQLTVRALADWCIVYLMQEDGTLYRTQVAHADPDDKLLAERLRSLPLPSHLPFPVLDVYRSGETVWATDLDRGAGSEDPGGVLRSLGAASFVAVPLKVRDTTFGVIAMISRDPARSYGPASISVAEKLAALCALAIDNARLYGEAREATRAKDELLHKVMHDLRNPLAAMRMGLGRLTRVAGRSSGTDGDFEILDRMKHLTDRMNHMIEQLVSRKDSDRAGGGGSSPAQGTGTET